MIIIEKSFFIVALVMILAAVLFFEESYRLSGKLPPTSEIIDLGGLAQTEKPKDSTTRSFKSSYLIINNSFIPQLNSTFNAIEQMRQLTIQHWEDNIARLRSLDVQQEAGKIKAIIDQDATRLNERYPRMREILQDHQKIVADIMDDDDLSLSKQIDLIAQRIKDALNINLEEFLKRHRELREELTSLMEQRGILRESILLSREGIEIQLKDIQKVLADNLQGDQSIDGALLRIEKRHRIIIENLQICHDQMGYFQSAIDKYIEEIVQAVTPLAAVENQKGI